MTCSWGTSDHTPRHSGVVAKFCITHPVTRDKMLLCSLRLLITLFHVFLQSIQVFALTSTHMAEQVISWLMNISYVSAQQSFFIENFIAFLTNFACICFVNISHTILFFNSLLQNSQTTIWMVCTNWLCPSSFFFEAKFFLHFSQAMKLSIMFLLAFFLFYIWLFQDVSLVFLFWCSGCNHLTCSVLCVSKLVLNIYHGEKWILLLCLNHCSLCKIFIWILFWLVVWTFLLAKILAQDGQQVSICCQSYHLLPKVTICCQKPKARQP